MIDRTNYDPYGGPINQVIDGIGYTGHVMDPTTGLTNMQQRYYDQGVGRFLSVDPVSASAINGGNFNRYWYANNNPYRFTDPDGRFSRGTGFSDKQWKQFDSAQQRAAGSLDKASAKIDRALSTGKGMNGVVRSFERNFGAGSATPANLAQVSSDMKSMAGVLRDTSSTAVPANGMSSAAMTAAFANMSPNVLAGVPTTGPAQVVVNLDHASFSNSSKLTWGIGHESGHVALGYKDQQLNGIPAYKYGSEPQQDSFKKLPAGQRPINPDHLMDQAR